MRTSLWLPTLLIGAGIACAVYALAPRLIGREGAIVFIVPADNPMSGAKVRLGRHLFYDRRLSFNDTIACADCHRQESAFADPRPQSIGATGERTPRNSMTLTNVAYNARFTWVNSTIRTLEQQAMVPLMQEHPLEMGVSRDEPGVMRRFRSDQRYDALFAAAFPRDVDPFTLGNAVKSISSFERTLVSLRSPYDRFIAGDTSAMSASAQRGLELFQSDRMKCTRCHGGINFRMTDRHLADGIDLESVAYHNIGVYNFPPPLKTLFDRPGVGEMTDASLAEGRFKAPTLRNIARTSPYLHDGSVATLGEVIDIYAAGGRVVADGPLAGDARRSPYKSPLVTGFAIAPEEKRDLIAFLESLTDTAFLTDRNLANPFADQD